MFFVFEDSILVGRTDQQTRQMTTWPPHMAESEDAQLVEAARNGDIGSFAELYERHYVRMVGVAYCILSDRHLAEDAAQEAFAIACRELGRLRRAEKFASWLGVLCRNAANRIARRRTEFVASEDVPAPRSDASRDGLHQAVRQSVQNLPWPAARASCSSGAAVDCDVRELRRCRARYDTSCGPNSGTCPRRARRHARPPVVCRQIVASATGRVPLDAPRRPALLVVAALCDHFHYIATGCDAGKGLPC